MKPERKIEFKDITGCKVTISPTRYDVKISISMSNDPSFVLIDILNKADRLFEENWSEDMRTFRGNLL